MMKILISTIVFLVALLVDCRAKIGQDLKGLEDLYGPIQTFTRKTDHIAQVGFTKGKLNLICILVDGRCEVITFGRNEAFSQSDIIALVKMSFPETEKWEPLGNSALRQVTEHGTNYLIVSEVNRFTICTEKGRDTADDL